MTNDHYVSQYYLKKFWFQSSHDVNQSRIFAYNLQSNKCEERSVKSICSRPNLFDSTIEKNFSKLESQFSKIIQKIEYNINNIKEHRSILSLITPMEFKSLTKMIEFQYRRSIVVHPEFQKRVEHDKLAIYSHIKEQFGQKVLDLPDITELLDGHAHQSVQHTVSPLFSTIILEDGTSWENVLLSKGWHIFFIECSAPAEFVSSDFPVYRFNKHGSNWIVDPNTEIIFPLTKKILLVVAWEVGDMQYHSVSNRTWIRDANKMIVANASELIFGSSKKLLERLGAYRKKERLRYPKNNFYYS